MLSGERSAAAGAQQQDDEQNQFLQVAKTEVMLLGLDHDAPPDTLKAHEAARRVSEFRSQAAAVLEKYSVRWSVRNSQW
ncbi:hypothetical protein GMLC_38770 [Geomonas limicola]|uniref:Uncharacterized protein n=1 Tax=Geomonas limicola TaxID=2740186 RepID=A0A6V8NCF3_9BACT|nr:hypothetical protein GMLC_38770 [Geomonas limicola]